MNTIFKKSKKLNISLYDSSKMTYYIKAKNFMLNESFSCIEKTVYDVSNNVYLDNILHTDYGQVYINKIIGGSGMLEYTVKDSTGYCYLLKDRSKSKTYSLIGFFDFGSHKVHKLIAYDLVQFS